jgi:uncharacterized damage-inducible protein DinB
MADQITESLVLANAFQSVRNLTKFYLSKLAGLDIDERFEINGKKLNSAHWLTGHIVWTEHFLLIEGLGGKPMDIPWLEKFEMGTEHPEGSELPAYDEILQTMDIVHEEAMKYLRGLSNEQLNEPNQIDLTMGGKNTRKAIILHAIRHEPMHTGQISWILKANGIKMV